MYYFKFCSPNHIVEILNHLSKGEVYGSSMKEMNDPFEDSWSGVIKDDKLRAPHHGEIMDKLERRRFFCLCSSDNKDFPCSVESIYMWSHYADGHTGFCIMFDENIIENVSEKVELLPITYHHDLVDINESLAIDDERERKKLL